MSIMLRSLMKNLFNFHAELFIIFVNIYLENLAKMTVKINCLKSNH